MTGALDAHRVASFFAAIDQSLVLDRHPAAEFEDVTRRQGFASRRSRCADTGPGARVIIVVLAAAGMCGVGSAGMASSRGCGGPAHWGLSEALRNGSDGCVLGA